MGIPSESTASAKRKVDEAASRHSATLRSPSETLRIPDYLEEIYHWAYLSPRNACFLDNEVVVSVILWGQHRRLQRAAFDEIESGSKVFLPANVYGRFVSNLARQVGPNGSLHVADISPTQIAICTRKTKKLANVSVTCADARRPSGVKYDVICCYFLLHELPDSDKRTVVDTLLRSLQPGGKAVFVDYHRPHWAHPLRPIIHLVFAFLEPFADSILQHSIEEFATKACDYSWRHETYFGGLYQRVVATRL